MSNQIEIKIILDQPMYPDTDWLLRRYIEDGFNMISSYSPVNVSIKEVNAADQREIGLQDKFGVEITDGCIVEVQGGFGKQEKGERYRCVWNIPQHRYGFMYLLKNSDVILNTIEDVVDCNFYATPRNVKKLKVV